MSLLDFLKIFFTLLIFTVTTKLLLFVVPSLRPFDFLIGVLVGIIGTLVNNLLWEDL